MNAIKPKYFFLENVPMDRESELVISRALGVNPIRFNSALVSAQDRERLYWTNIGLESAGLFGDMHTTIQPPKDKGLLIRDILEQKCLTAGEYVKNGKQGNYVRVVGHAQDIKGHDYNRRIYSQDSKSPTLNASSGGNLEPKVALNDFQYRKLTPIECERLQTLPDNYTEGVSNTQRYTMCGNGWTVDMIAHFFNHIK